MSKYLLVFFAMMLLGVPNSFAWTLTDSVGVQIPNGIFNGKWGVIQLCANGHVVGMRLKIHNDWLDRQSNQFGSRVGDEELHKGSGVTGVEFYCSNRGHYSNKQNPMLYMEELDAGQWQLIGLSFNIPPVANSTQPLRPIQGIRMYCEGGFVSLSERDQVLMYANTGVSPVLHAGHDALVNSYMRHDAMMEQPQVLDKNWGGMALCPEKKYMCGLISMGVFDKEASNIGMYDMVMYCCG